MTDAVPSRDADVRSSERPASSLPPHLAELYSYCLPPYEHVEFGASYAHELRAAQYVWKKGSYRSGVTVHILFFLLGDLVERGANARPERFGNIFNFAKSFDFTDVFIKRVTASGRGKAKGGGLKDPEVRGLLKGIQKAHDEIDIPHWMMTYFGFALMEQVEDDIGDLPEDLKQYHLQYMCRAYRIMGIPFSDDRELLVDFCRGVERNYFRYTPIGRDYTRKLIFLGLIVGAPYRRRALAETLPSTVRGFFLERYDELRPRFTWAIVGKLLGLVYYPYRRFRNTSPGSPPQFDTPGGL